MIPGSYHNGFAPRDGAPLYPQLWAGCTGAWCPSLGPTGAVLRDWSGKARHGTLENMTLDTAWSRSHTGKGGGSGALLFDGTDDDVNVGPILTAITGGLSLWINATSLSSDDRPISDTGGYFYLEESTAGNLRFVIFDGGAKNTPTAPIVADRWYHVVCVWGDAGFIRLYVDGVLIGSTAAGAIQIVTNPIQIGGVHTAQFRWRGYIDDIMWFNYVPPLPVISLLYSGGAGRGIAYTMREQNYYRSAARVPSGATMTGGMYVNQTGGMVA